MEASKRAMEQRFEQTVSSDTGGARRALYIGAWILMIILALGMLVAAAGILGTTEAGSMRLNWPSLVLFLLLAALAVFIWFKKDALKLEYDYALEDGALRVSAIFNARRRQERLNLPLTAVQSCGDAASGEYRRVAARPGLKMHRLYCNSAAPLCYFLYSADGKQHVALVELNPELRNAVRIDRRLPLGAWHEGEGTT